MGIAAKLADHHVGIEATDQRLRVSFSLSGTVIQQLRDWAPEALESFVKLAETGCAEFLCETSHHSLAFDGDWGEFEDQVSAHRLVIEDLFGTRPTTLARPWYATITDGIP